MYSERHPMHDTERSMAVNMMLHDKVQGNEPKWRKNNAGKDSKKTRLVCIIILLFLMIFLVGNYYVAVTTGNLLVCIGENQSLYEGSVLTERFSLGFEVYELKGISIDTYRIVRWGQTPEFPYILSREQKQAVEEAVHNFAVTSDKALATGIYIHDALIEGENVVIYGWYAGVPYLEEDSTGEEYVSSGMIVTGNLQGDDLLVGNIQLDEKEKLEPKIPTVTCRSMDEEGNATAVERAELAARCLKDYENG